ncbi:hypothetical protein [Pseudobacteriovorax antillogorgiicola]|uniref:Lipoprotein n=1 Tax=Pseudobacteriovorax antillogorgiicola TaxID=1513793 RepID=A0A1Y6CR89_9BACT|nr:hypothetical protein [Pseudobacteriovorax antillogorgiicola]TCS45879.1 hypothetical protein EDD56_12642 [Pseudobacteriovorax antillogorgiicola]SMF71241.1 hypothetical protein SAMN06296036_12656 [Pseudobacteriovorax antillogorgiicola]
MLRPRRLFLTAFILLITSCSHIETEPYGIQKEHIAFVPARIGVIACREWPYNARYYKQPITNFSPVEIKEICDALDAFVLKGFEGQPYMRGLSPKVVGTLLQRANQDTLLSEINELWHQQESDCKTCANSVSHYKQSIAPRKEWQQWLGRFSRNVYNTDAILVPMVLYAQKGRSDERGLAIAYRRVGISLLLIDTNNGRLIWAGGRDVQANNRKLDSDTHLNTLALPSWKQVSSRLLVKDIWTEFPGRQNY